MKTLASWAPAPDLNVTAVEPGELAWIISVDRRDAEQEQGHACCPVCGTQSSSRHSSYTRTLRDLSAQGKPVNIVEVATGSDSLRSGVVGVRRIEAVSCSRYAALARFCFSRAMAALSRKVCIGVLPK